MRRDMQVMDFTTLDKMKKGNMARPAWLTHLASQAQVEVTCLSVMNSFLDRTDGGIGLKELINDMIGDASCCSASLQHISNSCVDCLTSFA